MLPMHLCETFQKSVNAMTNGYLPDNVSPVAPRKRKQTNRRSRIHCTGERE